MTTLPIITSWLGSALLTCLVLEAGRQIDRHSNMC